MIKVVLGLSTVVLATVVAAKLAYDVTTYTGDGPVNQPWAQNSMELVAWNGEKWTAWVRESSFEQRPQNDEKWSRHSTECCRNKGCRMANCNSFRGQNHCCMDLDHK